MNVGPVLNWVLFGITGILAYVFLSMFGQLSGGTATSALGAALAAFKPIPFLFLVVGNVLWGVAVFFGLRNSSYAIPAAIAVGIMTSFVYSVVVLDSSVTWTRLLGLAVVLLGIYLIK